MKALVLGYIRPELDYTSRGYHLLLSLLVHTERELFYRGSHRRYQHR
jgi:hypothetical protein